MAAMQIYEVGATLATQHKVLRLLYTDGLFKEYVTFIMALV